MFDGMSEFEIDPDDWRDLNDQQNIADLNANNKDVPANTQAGLGGMGMPQQSEWSVGGEIPIPPGEAVDWSKSHPGTASQGQQAPSGSWGDAFKSAVGGASKFVQGQAKIDEMRAQGELNRLKAEQTAANQAYAARMNAVRRQSGYQGSWISRYGTTGIIIIALVAGGIYYFSKKRRR
jgi:hypothetical protein